MSDSTPALITTAALGLSSAAAILFARTGSSPVEGDEPFSGERSQNWIDRLLLAGTLFGSVLHALIARTSFEICSKLSFDVPNDVFRFWFQAGPAIAIWCAACLAGRWRLRDGLTDDGRAVWATLIYIGVGGWLFSGLGALFHGFGGWHK